MINQHGIPLLVLCVFVCSFGLSKGNACEDHWDCMRCDKIKSQGKCASYQSVCYKTCSGCGPYADMPYQPCADIKKRGDCFNSIPYKPEVWAQVCAKTCCVLGTPPKWSEWSKWSSCSRSCHYGIKSRIRTCIGAGFGQTCTGSALETAKCNENVPCQGIVGWDKNSVEVDECAKTVTVKITRSRVTNCEASITINTQDGTAKQPGDYNQIKDLVIKFLKGETSKSVTFKINGDIDIEGIETFFATITANPVKLEVKVPKCTIKIKDQSATIGFKPKDYVVSENAGTVKVTVVRQGNKNGKNTCSVSSADDSATAPADYKAVSNVPVVFEAGQVSKDIEVQIVDDKLQEPNENFKLSLTCEKSPCTKVEPDQANVVIKSDDVNGGWSQWTPYGNCDKKCGGGGQSRSRTCTNPKPQGEGKQCEGKAESTRACNIHHCPIDGGYNVYSPYDKCTKTCGGGVQYKHRVCNNPKPQYGGKPCQGPVKSSQACNTHHCPIDGGYNVYSPYDKCTKTCGGGVQYKHRVCNNPKPQYGGKPCQGPVKSSQACNTHHCPGYVEWEKTTVTVDECAGTVTVNIVRAKTTDIVASIRVKTSGDSATEGVDYEKQDIPLTFKKGEKSTSVTFKAISDNVIEQVEKFTAVITADNPADLIVSPGKGVCTISIKEQSAIINFEKAKYTASENDGSVKVKIIRNGNTDGENACTVKSQDGTAKAPGDYNAVDAPVVFKQGETFKEVEITIKDDSEQESTEKFGLSLTCEKPKCVKVNSANVQITDDDVNGGWSQWTPYGDCDKKCGGGGQSRSRTCTNPKPQGEGKQCEGKAESTRACNTHHCPIDGGYNVYSPYDKCTKTCGGGVQYKHRVCNNPKPQYGGKPCQGPVKSSQACNTLHCPIDGGYNVYSPYDKCTKTCGGGVQYKHRVCNNPKPQYGGKPCQGPVKSSQACNTHHCPIDGNWSPWGPWSKGSRSCGGATQYRTRTCTNPKPQYGGKNCQGSNKETRGCNPHPCPAKVGLKPVRQTVPESIGKVKVTVFRIGNSIGSNRVHVSTVPKTAKFPSDFVNIPETEIIFKPGESSKVVIITIVDDKVPEEDEEFELRLKSNDPGVVSVNPDTATIKILDDDVRLGLRPAKQSVRESVGTVTLTVFREGNRRGETTAIINTCDQSAKAPGDYIALKNFPVKFAPGEKVKTFNVKIVDDKLVELIEDFCVTLSSPDKDVTEIKPEKAVVAIVDNDVKLGIYPKFSKVLESKGYVSLRVVRYGNLKGSTTAVINTQDNTAKAGPDYKPRVNFKLIFAPGQTVQHFKVFIENDNIPESPEDFRVVLSSPDQDVTVISPKVSVVKIIDDDAKIGFEKIKYFFDETAGTVKVAIVRSGAIHLENTVVIKSVDDTAKAPADFIKVYQKITFAKDQKRVEISIKINNDKEQEGRETFKLVLTTEDIRVQLEPSKATVCIVDNDVDGKWGPWTSWSQCGKTCGYSTQSRSRKCDNPAPKGEGKPCEGKEKESRKCYVVEHCPVNGGFSEWSVWGKCSRSCGGGHATRNRKCNNPVPQYGGWPCIGSPIEIKSCNKKCCPVNGQWGAWSKWTPCSVTCLSIDKPYGYRTRSRKCDNPAPSCGGAECAGGSAAAVEKAKCSPYTPCSAVYVVPMSNNNPYGKK